MKAPEKLIYVLLPRYIVPNNLEDSLIKMECGRLFAQACHAVSKLKLRLKMDPDIETTTITLQVPTNADLLDWFIKISELTKSKDIQAEVFHDTNKEFYGTPDKQLTAIAIMCTRKQGKKHFHSLLGWRCDLECTTKKTKP